MGFDSVCVSDWQREKYMIYEVREKGSRRNENITEKATELIESAAFSSVVMKLLR